LYLAAGGIAGEAPWGPAPAARKGGEQLNLSATTLAGMKVYYEKALEPHLPAFERELVRFAAKILGGDPNSTTQQQGAAGPGN